MNFIVSSGSLAKHLQSISGVLSTSNTLPVLDNFLFDIENNELTVSASDLETTMRTKLNVEANESGKICVPAKMILEILKNLPEQPCTFLINEDFKIEISYDNGKSNMSGYNGNEYPKLPAFEKKNHLKVTGEIISKAINKTLFATGTDDLRPIMSGVFCQFSPEELIFVATDAHKLVCYKRKDSIAEGSASFILPKKPLNILKSNLKGDEEVMLEFNDSNAVFTFNDTELVCRLIDGKYPNYEAVIPTENPNELTVDRLQFLGALKRVSIFSNKSTHQVKLSLAGQELSLFAEDLDFSNQSSERLTCSYDGEDIEIAFNSKFLMEMLSNLDSSEVKIKMSAPNRAGILIPVQTELDNENEDILMLVMPVMLNR
jgi:DNA polymerase-3 subunit beta